MEFYTKHEVMNLLKLDNQTYRLYINKGILKPYRSSPGSRKFLFKKSEIEEVFKPTITTKIICVTNQKGGVGKTTLTHNIGVGLSSRHYRTLLIDMDPQNNLSAAMGMDTDIDPSKTIVMIFENHVDVKNKIVHKINNYLSIVPSSILLSGVESKSDISSYFKLKKFIQSIFNDYDFIIIDSPPSLGTLTSNAFMSTEYVLIPVVPDFYSPLGTNQLLERINESKEFNPSLKVLGVVINKKDSRTSVSNTISDQMREELKTVVFDTVINQNTKITESPFEGKSVLEYDKSSKGAGDFRNLIDEIIERVKVN